ncbi:hypothetical protein SDC9_104217 [bioreactor metagenome]|uniref:HTH cro/C1-type domain-containing protein n=1 Tax=bioreactor metagenome TaxID=1076179 RepID=A0A645AVX2_9ZZZZ
MKNNLKEIRTKEGLSGLELSRRAAIAPSVISNIENNRIVAWPGWRKKLAEALDVSESELFPEETNEREN